MTGIISTAIVAYAALCAFMFVAQRNFLYAPNRSRPDQDSTGAPQMDVVELTAADGLPLLAWYRAPKNDRLPMIVYFHGNAGHIGDRATKMAPFLKAGFGLLLLSYRGYGGNPGKPTEQGLYADARAALDFGRDQGVGEDRLAIYGESLGSGVAVQMATERPIAALVLEAPFTSMTKVAHEKVPYVPVPLLIRDRYDSLSKIGDVEAPLLVIHGEADRTVPVGHGRRLFAAAADPKQSLFLPHAGHADVFDFGVADEVRAFLLRIIGETGAPMPVEARGEPAD